MLTHDGYEVTNRVALEPEVFANLQKYAASFYGPREADPVAPAS